jgi:hypothetical protein
MYWKRSGGTDVEIGGGAPRCANAAIVSDKAQVMPTHSLESMYSPRKMT